MYRESQWPTIMGYSQSIAYGLLWGIVSVVWGCMAFQVVTFWGVYSDPS